MPALAGDARNAARRFEHSHFYSDSHNDIPLLSVVTHPVATNPNAALARPRKPAWLAFTPSVQI